MKQLNNDPEFIRKRDAGRNTPEAEARYRAAIYNPERLAKLSKAASKAVEILDPDTMEVVAEYSSARNAGIETGYNEINIGQACNGKYYKTGHIFHGYYWRYKQ